MRSIFCLESSSRDRILWTYWLLRNRRSAFSCSNLRTDDLRSEEHQKTIIKSTATFISHLTYPTLKVHQLSHIHIMVEVNYIVIIHTNMGVETLRILTI